MLTASVLAAQASTSFVFGVSPLLACLQSMTSVPLADEIVHGMPPAAAGCLTPEQVEQVMNRKGGSWD